MEGRSSNTMALLGLLGRGAMGWDGLLADARHDAAQERLRTLPGDIAATGPLSGAANAGNVA